MILRRTWVKFQKSRGKNTINIIIYHTRIRPHVAVRFRSTTHGVVEKKIHGQESQHCCRLYGKMKNEKHTHTHHTQHTHNLHPGHIHPCPRRSEDVLLKNEKGCKFLLVNRGKLENTINRYDSIVVSTTTTVIPYADAVGVEQSLLHTWANTNQSCYCIALYYCHIKSSFYSW